MNVTTPDWLLRRDGNLLDPTVGESRFVLIGGRPHYKLTPFPADGKFACAIMQTINGKRFDKGELFPSADEAIRGGLEGLRKSLGW